MVQLDILSDPVCPWCALGYANLARALETRPGHPLRLEWHPFQLNPDLPREGVERAAWMRGHFADPAALEAIHDRIARMGQAVGLDFAFDRIGRMPNTLDAHRLLHWAGLEGRQTPMAAALFGAYWQQGRDIGAAGELVALAGEVGLDGAMVARLLASDADVEAIRAREAHSRARGVSGVPTFILGGRHVLSGAQPPELWQRVIDDLAGSGAAPPEAG